MEIEFKVINFVLVMIKIAFTVLLISFSLSVFSQVSEMNVKWGDEIPAKRRVVSDLYSIGNENEFFAINTSLRLTKGGSFLQKYENLNLVKEIELTTEQSRSESYVQDILELNNELYLMSYRRDRESKSLTAQGVDPETLSFSGSEEPVYNIKLSKGIRNTYGEYRSAIAPEETKIVYVVEHPGDKTSNSVASVKLFDDNFDLLWNNKITLKSTKELTTIYSITVSDEGTAYLLTKVYDPKSESSRNERNYEFYIISVTENGIQSEERLALKDYYITKLKLDIDAQGNLLCGGFYSKEGGKSDGIFYTTLDKEDYSVNTLSLKEFDLDFITQGMSERAKKKQKKRADKGKDVGIANINFRDIVLKEDGGAVLVGEYVNIFTTTTTTPNGGVSTTTHYYYDDIYVINIDEEGQIEWAEKIIKTQHTTNDGGFYSSFFMVVNDEYINFFYNVRDRKENILRGVSIDEEGKTTTKNLVSTTRKDNIRIRPKSCEQISENEFILFGISKKFNRFARVRM